MKFLDAAMSIAHRLAKEAIWHDGRCTWMGNDVEFIDDDWKVVYQTIDAYLYSGNAGIARFLMYCCQEKYNVSLKKTAIGAICQSLHFAEQHLHERLPLGLYDGLLGIVLVATEIDIHLQQSVFTDRVKRITDEIQSRISSNNTSDILSGSAGNMVGLIKLSKITGNTALYKECHFLAEKLLKESHHTIYGWYWDKIDSIKEGVGFSGYAHGASGVSHALIEYGQISDNECYFHAAQQGIRYERSWFDRRQSNWADTRNNDTDKNGLLQKFSYPVFWCYGAGGIGLARLRSYTLTNDKNMLAEASAALQAATSQARYMIKNKNVDLSPEINLSVCHGLGSIIDLFIYAYQVLGHEEFLKRARDIGTFSINISHHGKEEEYWRCGIHGGGETPGFMLGLAGIGYNFLRLHNPLAYPSPAGLEI